MHDIFQIAEIVTLIGDFVSVDYLSDFMSTCKFIFESCRSIKDERIIDWRWKVGNISLGFIRLVGGKNFADEYIFIYPLITYCDIAIIKFIIECGCEWRINYTRDILSDESRADILHILPNNLITEQDMYSAILHRNIAAINIIHERGIEYNLSSAFVIAIMLAHLQTLKTLCEIHNNIPIQIVVRRDKRQVLIYTSIEHPRVCEEYISDVKIMLLVKLLGNYVPIKKRSKRKRNNRSRISWNVDHIGSSKCDWQVKIVPCS